MVIRMVSVIDVAKIGTAMKDLTNVYSALIIKSRFRYMAMAVQINYGMDVDIVASYV